MTLSNIPLFRPLQEKSTSNCESIAVTRDMTADQCMKLALSRFGLQDEDCNNFVMTTVQVDKAITDRKLQLDECPFNIIQNIAQVSAQLCVLLIEENRLNDFPMRVDVVIIYQNTTGWW